MDRGAWWATVHVVAKSRTWLSDFTSLSLSIHLKLHITLDLQQCSLSLCRKAVWPPGLSDKFLYLALAMPLYSAPLGAQAALLLPPAGTLHVSCRLLTILNFIRGNTVFTGGMEVYLGISGCQVRPSYLPTPPHLIYLPQPGSPPPSHLQGPARADPCLSTASLKHQSDWAHPHFANTYRFFSVWIFIPSYPPFHSVHPLLVSQFKAPGDFRWPHEVANSLKPSFPEEWKPASLSFKPEIPRCLQAQNSGIWVILSPLGHPLIWPKYPPPSSLAQHARRKVPAVTGGH